MSSTAEALARTQGFLLALQSVNSYVNDSATYDIRQLPPGDDLSSRVRLLADADGPGGVCDVAVQPIEDWEAEVRRLSPTWFRGGIVNDSSAALAGDGLIGLLRTLLGTDASAARVHLGFKGSDFYEASWDDIALMSRTGDAYLLHLGVSD